MERNQPQTAPLKYYLILFSLCLIRLREKYLALVDRLEFEKALGNLPSDADPKAMDQFEAMVSIVQINDNTSQAK